MKLTDEQKAAVQRWADEGVTLSEIQDRLRAEFDVHLTYMEARLLLLDLDVQEKQEAEPEPKPEDPADEAGDDAEDSGPADAALGGGVALQVDELALPGTIASGKVTFSDNKTVRWYLDQMGRLGLQGAETGYQPPAEDIPAFQRQLQAALRRRGY